MFESSLRQLCLVFIWVPEISRTNSHRPACVLEIRTNKNGKKISPPSVWHVRAQRLEIIDVCCFMMQGELSGFLPQPILSAETHVRFTDRSSLKAVANNVLAAPPPPMCLKFNLIVWEAATPSCAETVVVAFSDKWTMSCSTICNDRQRF